LVMARSLIVGMARDPWLGAGHDGGQGGLVVGMTVVAAGDSTAPVVRMVTAGAVRLVAGAIRR
jgi:hypothetical protein